MSVELTKFADDNLQVFNTESRRGYYGKKPRNVAKEGQLNEIGDLQLKPEVAEVQALENKDQNDKFEQSIFEFEEDVPLEQKNQKPLNQLKTLSEKFKYTTPSKMFQFKNREALRKYVDKTKDFDGEAIFFQDKLCIMQRTFSMDQGTAQLKIVEISLNKYLDQCEDYNNDMEAFTEMVKPFNHVTITPEAGKDDLNKQFFQAFEKSEKSRKIEFIQNGKYIYVYTMNTSVRKGNNFETKGSTTFELQEIDLTSGKMAPVASSKVVAKDNDKNGHITASIGLTRRHGLKISPTADKELSRDEFLKNHEVVTVHEICIKGQRLEEKVVLKTIGNMQELYCLYEGPLGCRLHFTTRVNSTDLLRLREENIVNKNALMAHKRYAHDVGVVYLNEDLAGVGHFNIVEVLPNAGKSGRTVCEKYTAIDCSAVNVQSFKLRMTSNNFKYLYDQPSDSFIFRRSQPVLAGTLVINDLILNKIIFIEDTDEPKEYKLKVNNITNHGISFQSISCHKLGSFETYGTNFRANYLTLSNFLANKFPLLDPRLRKQVVVSRTIKNMARCEEKILHWTDGTKDASIFDDADFKVKSLGLIHTNYICDKDLKNKVAKMKSTKSAYLSPIPQHEWKTKENKTFLPMSKGQQMQQVFIRLHSNNNKMLLPCVSQNDEVKEPRVDLFSFSLGGQIPTDKEYACIESDHAWQIYHERVRFENDDAVQRPLIFSQSVKDDTDHFVRQHFWFTIFDFQSEEIVSQANMNFPDLIQSYEIEDISISACTEVTLRADKMYEQRFQVAFYLKHQLRAKIVEYTVTWDYLNGRQVTIKHTCSKEFILQSPDVIDTSVEAEGAGLKGITGRLQQFQKPVNDSEHVHLIPYMDKTNQIVGTQLIYGDANCPSVFIFENAAEKTTQKGSKIPFVVDEGYKIYKDEIFGSYTGILVYSKMSEGILSDKILNHQEKAEIIEDSVKSILNSVIFDPTLSAPWQLKEKDYNEEFLKNIDIGRGVEIFDWFSITSLKMDNQSLEQVMEDAKRHDEDDHKRYMDATLLSCSSLLERVLINDLVDQRTENKTISENHQIQDYDRVRSLQGDQFYIKGHEILQRDIYLNHPLHYIFEMEVEDKECNNDQYVAAILQFVFSEYNNCSNSYHLEAQEHLMSMIGDLMERNQNKVFYDNFLAQKTKPDPTSNKTKNGSLNICKPIEYRGMPRTQGSELQAFAYKHEVHEFRQNENYTAQEYLKKQELEEGYENKVECLMLDLRFYLFEQKVKHIKSHTDHNGEISDSCYNPSIMPDFGYTSFDLSNLLLDIVEKTDGDIVDQKLVKHVIDWQYKSTRTVTKWMLFGYAFGFFIPFFIQMYCFIGPVVIVCNSMCMFTSLLLMRFEIEQLRLQGCEYFASGMNWVDLMGFFTYSTYFGLRISNPDMVMPDYKQNTVEDTLTLLSFPLIQYTSLKLLFFFKMFEEFGKFQHMVGAALGGIKFFLPFMLFWIFVCSCQLYSIGSSYAQDDYPDLHEFIGILIQTWRNSLDNVAPPDYSKWSANLKEEQKEGLGWYSMLMIYMSWFIWFFNLVFIFLVLCNFLVSIIGNAYGEAVEQERAIVYALKSDLNQEVSLFNKWQSRDFELDSIFIVSKTQDIGQFEGNLCDISASVKNQLNEINSLKKSVNSKVQENGHKMDKLSSYMSKK